MKNLRMVRLATRREGIAIPEGCQKIARQLIAGLFSFVLVGTVRER